MTKPSTFNRPCQRSITATGSAAACSVMFDQTSPAPPSIGSLSAKTSGAFARQRSADHQPRRAAARARVAQAASGSTRTDSAFG